MTKEKRQEAKNFIKSVIKEGKGDNKKLVEKLEKERKAKQKTRVTRSY